MSEEKSAVDKPKDELFPQWMLLFTNFFVERDRLEAYLAVYFINFKNWPAHWIGIISLVMNSIQFVLQTPAGNLLDTTSHKKSLTVVSLLVLSLCTICVVWTSNFWAVLAIKSIEGVSAVILFPALISILFGICPPEDVARFVASNEVANKTGSIVFTIAAGLIAHFLFPDVSPLFYLFGAGGLFACGSLFLVPSEAINDARARQMETPEESNKDNGDESSTAASYRSLLQDKNIRMFAFLTFVYHLANAALLPLVAQRIAEEDAKTALVFTSGVLLVGNASATVTSIVIRSVVDKLEPRVLLLMGQAVFITRCGCLAALSAYSGNRYALCSTQILDGMGASVYDAVQPVIVSRLTQNSGRFNVTFGFVVTCHRIGHGLSLLLGESIVHASSYEAAFLTHGVIGMVSFAILFFGVEVPPQYPKNLGTLISVEDKPEDQPVEIELHLGPLKKKSLRRTDSLASLESRLSVSSISDTDLNSPPFDLDSLGSLGPCLPVDSMSDSSVEDAAIATASI